MLLFFFLFTLLNHATLSLDSLELWSIYKFHEIRACHENMEMTTQVTKKPTFFIKQSSK